MDRLSYGAYLYALEPDVLAVLTMHGEILLDLAILSGFTTSLVGITDNETPTQMAATGWHWLRKACVANDTLS